MHWKLFWFFVAGAAYGMARHVLPWWAPLAAGFLSMCAAQYFANRSTVGKTEEQK